MHIYILTRSRLGLLPVIFCLFVTELWPLIDMILFLLNIFRTWAFLQHEMQGYSQVLVQFKLYLNLNLKSVVNFSKKNANYLCINP